MKLDLCQTAFKLNSWIISFKFVRGSKSIMKGTIKMPGWRTLLVENFWSYVWFRPRFAQFFLKTKSKN